MIPKPSHRGHDHRRLVNIDCEGNVFWFNYLNHSKVVSEFVGKLNIVLAEGCKEIVLDFSRVKRQFFPSVIVPLTGLIDALKKDGISVRVKNWSFRSITNSFKPSLFAPGNGDVLNSVWKFDANNIYSLNEAIFNELEQCEVFPKGVTYLASWSLNEVMDNVLNHSDATEGYIMAQLHRKTKHIAFCVYDTGIGFMDSFKNSDRYKPKSQIDAIQLAIQENVTSNKEKGQGNGLFGLHSLVNQGDGKLSITSGNGSYLYIGKMPKTFNNLVTYKNLNSHTCIDFVVDYSTEMDVAKVLTFKNIDYKPVNLRIENLEDERGNVLFKIKEIGDGTGTRQAALKLKNRIMNILIEEPKNIILDFENVNVISSSYADELIAKLLVDLGLFQFNQLIRLRNLNDNMQIVLQRSVIQRFIDSYTLRDDSLKFKDIPNTKFNYTPQRNVFLFPM